MKATLFVWREDGYPYIAWIKDDVLACQVQDYLKEEDVMHLERHDYTLGECDIEFEDDFFIELLAGDDDDFIFASEHIEGASK